MKKRLIIYDTPEELTSRESSDVMFSAKPQVKPCVGCFTCWIKTPGKCAVNDRCADIPKHIAECDEMMLISPVLYGGYSENVKAVIDRSIPYILPFFRIVDGEMHHCMRHRKNLKLTACFYGECDNEERRIAESVVKANAINFGAESFDVKFYDTVEQLRGDIL